MKIIKILLPFFFAFFTIFPMEAKILRAGNLDETFITEASTLGGKKFRIVGKVMVEGYTNDEILQKMRAKAHHYEATAVIAFKKMTATSGSVFNQNAGGTQISATVSLLQAEGILVIEDSQGIENFTGSEVVPILP